jgi:hypothetical protein
MNTGQIIAGLALLAIAVWIFLTMTDATARYLGSVILGILGIALLAKGIKRK